MRVGEHDLDLDRGLLTRNGVPVHLRAKTFRLLCHFAGHPGRVISKDELIEAVWPEVSVTELLLHPGHSRSAACPRRRGHKNC